uniref:Uncharacterized protein n=1 Tax=Bracon brevicornis TaxID=1563983 RepID=A0A6V7IDR1_9HYME
MRATLFRVIKDALYPKEYVWERNAETGINTYEGKVDTEAALTNLDVTVDYAAAFWKTVSYKGCIGDTGVWLEYEARTYISHVNPDPYGIDNCFLDVHRFPLGRPHVAGPEPMTYAIGERNNISNSPGVLEMHENRNRENFDHTFAWTTFDSSLVIAAAWSERDRRNRTVVD